MTQRTGGISRPLARARVYSTVQQALGAERVWQTVIRDHLRPRSGERVLDLGCGPGDILRFLPAVAYLGVDLSPAYIAAARDAHGTRGEFVQADVGEYEPPAAAFDAVVAIGMLHHLDDVGARRLLSIARAALAPEGRLVTLDPGRTVEQPRLARWLIERDRGRNVRSPQRYRHLAAESFEDITLTVRHDLARVPITHVILECRLWPGVAR